MTVSARLIKNVPINIPDINPNIIQPVIPILTVIPRTYTALAAVAPIIIHSSYRDTCLLVPLTSAYLLITPTLVISAKSPAAVNTPDIAPIKIITAIIFHLPCQ